jgi:hypothetical protein
MSALEEKLPEGAIFLLYASDMAKEGDELARRLCANRKIVFTPKDIEVTVQLGVSRFQIHERLLKEISKFLIIPSEGFESSEDLMHFYYALDLIHKIVIPVKFSERESKMPYLETIAPVRLYPRFKDEKMSKDFINNQFKMLLEVL